MNKVYEYSTRVNHPFNQKLDKPVFSQDRYAHGAAGTMQQDIEQLSPEQAAQGDKEKPSINNEPLTPLLILIG